MNNGIDPNGGYVIALDRDSSQAEYIASFEGNLVDFLDGLKPKERNQWMRDSSHHSRDTKFPSIRYIGYASNPDFALRFNCPNKAYLFGIYLRSFFPDSEAPKLRLEEI